MRPPRNILIIKPGAIGDLLKLTPVIRALKQHAPGSSISVLVGSDDSASLFRNNPLITGTIVYDRHGTHASPAAFLMLWKRIRSERFDLVLNFQRSNIKAWLLMTAAFPCRILVYRKSRRLDLHAVDNYLETIAPLRIEIQSRELELHLGPADRSAAEQMLAPLLGSGRPIIALNPGASHAVNRWPSTKFSLFANRLSEKLDCRIVIIGGTEDKELADEVAAGMVREPLMLTGRLTLLQLGAVLQRCSLLVTGDTGPMHVATAVGTPVAALFGAADPARTGPVGLGHRVIQARDVSCVPCRSRRCSNPDYLECMKRIEPDRVVREVAEMLEQNKSI